MSTTDQEPIAAPNETALVPKLSPRWALKPIHLAIVGFWCFFFMLLNYLPLRGTDLWGHAAYGRWILEHGRLPTEDPFAGLAVGMKVVDSAWLSQLIFACVERWGGGEALSGLFALTTLATFVILARTYYLQSRRTVVCMGSVLAVLIVGWSRLTTIRPENFAALCFAGLLWMIVSSGECRTAAGEGASDGKSRWLLWIGIPLVMTLWANLHGSFVCGLALLGCYFLGQVAEVAWQTRSLADVLADRATRRWLYLCELSVAATLVNPYGVDLLLYTLLFSGNENLKDILEWQPLVILGVGGREFAFSWVVLMVAFRHSRQRIPAAHVLLLAVFGLAVIAGVRMLSWYAAVFGIALTPHLAELMARIHPLDERGRARAPEIDEGSDQSFALPPGRRWSYSLVALLLIWIALALSPIGRPIVGDDSRSSEQLHASSTPLGISQYLRENPPDGQIFNPQWWGDWLVWDGPADLRPFMTTNMHLAPRQVWRDYQRIIQTQPGWQRALDRYRVDTVVVDKERQVALVRLIRRSSDWTLAFEDEQGMVLRRRSTIAESSDEPDSAQSIEADVQPEQEPTDDPDGAETTEQPANAASS
jgi:hypothetical protein